MAKIVTALALLTFLVFVGSQVVVFLDKKGDAQEEYRKAAEAAERAIRERNELREEFEYLSNPENFEKELRARFNYRAPGEKTIILVPRESVEE